ncbi:MAG TPA: RNA methyltransferase [Pyrinomonadaceae bacterium]|jgi:TrmH family RNA methyltransferase
MSEQVITSRDNERVRHARSVREGKAEGEIFVEGVRLCEEAARARLVIKDVLHTEELSHDGRAARLLSDLKKSGARAAVASQKVFASLSDTKTPQGIVVIAARPPTDASVLEQALKKDSLLVILHQLNNPANAGAILRTAEAAGAGGIISTAGTTDLFSAKALRGAMGSSFRLPVWTGAQFSEALKWCAARGILTICADVRAARSHTEFDWTIARALIVGAEASGLSDDEIAQADEALKIPMRPPVESLNVAVAAAIVLYEAARQRAVGSGQRAVGSKDKA